MILRTVTAVTCFILTFICLASAAVITDTGMYGIAVVGEFAALVWGTWGIVIITLEETEK